MADRLADASAPPMFQEERQDEIVLLTIQHGRVEVADLARRFGVTTETIRRDLAELQDRNLLRRVHGGAMPWVTVDFEPKVAVRNTHHDLEKRRLARRAVSMLPSSGAIIIDSGSTLTRFAEAIPVDAQLQVVTSSIGVAQALVDHEGVRLVIIGGEVRKGGLAMVGADAVAAVAPLTVDTLFISADGFSAEMGLTTPYRDEAALKRAMVRAAHRVVAIVDHSKVRQDQFISFASWADIDVLVTNNEVGDDVAAAIEAHGTSVVLA